MLLMSSIRRFCLVSISAIYTATSPVLAQRFANSMGIGADPTVIMLGGTWYGSVTSATGDITIYAAPQLVSLFSPLNKTRVLLLHPDNAKSIWAPDFQLINGTLYMYYFDNADNCSHVVEFTEPDPINSTFVNHTEVSLPGYDWTVYFRAGDQTLWGFFTSGPSLYGVRMTDPLHLAKQRDYNEITHVTETWESTDTSPGGIVEAPMVFTHTVGTITTTFMDYSANGYTSNDYEMGLLIFTGRPTDPLDDASRWQKQSKPIFSRNQFADGAYVVSVGSNVVVPSDDGSQLWNVYTARFRDAAANDRVIRAQEIHFDGNIPNFGEPQHEGELADLPGGETGLPQDFMTHARGGTYDSQDPHIFYSAPAYNQTPWTSMSVSTRGIDTKTKSNSAANSYVMFKFFGRLLDVFGSIGPQNGVARVYSDGNYVKTIDLYSPVARSSSRLYSAIFPSRGLHTVLLVVTGKKNSASGGNRVTIEKVQVR